MLKPGGFDPCQTGRPSARPAKLGLPPTPVPWPPPGRADAAGAAASTPIMVPAKTIAIVRISVSRLRRPITAVAT